MPSHKITNVQNATDMRRLMAEIGEEDVSELKAMLTGSPDSRIGLYCGLLGPIKEIPLLLDAARLVHQSCAEFHLVIIGTGPDREWLEQSVSAEPWIHYVGKKFGREFASYFKMADVFLLAGTAGLAIVDSFAAGLPVIATEMSTHPPEISYLVDGENGRITRHNAAALAAAVIECLTTPKLLDKLRTGADAAGNTYTTEAMVKNYSAGIKQCLSRNGFASRISVTTSRYRADKVDA
jgi:L-malate glycosyltransferase